MHVSPSKKYYIGITSQAVNKRWKNGKGYKSSPYFYNAIQKYGWNNFEHNILFTDLNEEEAKLKEKELIKLYKSNIREFGYNRTEGGDGACGREVTKEQIEKISNSLKGKKHTNEWKKHMSELMSGRKMTDEWKDKISKSHIGSLNPSARKIVQINNKHELIKVYDCMKYASEELDLHTTHIQDVCDKKYTNTGGYIFMYYDEYMEHKEQLLNLEPIKINHYRKLIIQCDLDENEIRKYDSIRQAERETGINHSNISNALRGRCKTSGGYIWKYARTI